MYLEKLSTLERQFKRTKYQDKLDELRKFANEGNVQQFERVCAEFPSEDELLASFLDRLKDKPVYKTLKKLGESKDISVYESLKGLFSLGTHLCISCEKGELENRLLLDSVYHKIGQALFTI